MKLGPALAIAALTLGCGGPPQGQVPPHPRPDASPPDAGAARPRLTRHARVSFELEGRPFPLPLIRGSVGGNPTWMLVDTGANSHVIAGWFAKKASLATTRAGDVGTDHAGKSIQTSRVEHPRVTVEGWGELADGPMLVTEVPALLEKLGIGMFLSPQRLVEEGDAVVLDLSTGDLRAAWFDEASRAELPGGQALAGATTKACTDDDSVIKGLAFVVPARIEGVSARLLLDTGAQKSDLLAGSSPGKALAPRSVPNKEQMYGASGRLTSRTIAAAKLSSGEVTRVVDLDLIGGESDPYCPRDGVLSMDVLRSCVLVMGRTQLVARCKGP